MSITVLTKAYKNLPFNKKEILRYADCKDLSPEIEMLLEQGNRNKAKEIIENLLNEDY